LSWFIFSIAVFFGKPRVRLGYNLSQSALFENLQAVWNFEKQEEIAIF